MNNYALIEKNHMNPDNASQKSRMSRLLACFLQMKTIIVHTLLDIKLLRWGISEQTCDLTKAWSRITNEQERNRNKRLTCVLVCRYLEACI